MRIVLARICQMIENMNGRVHIIKATRKICVDKQFDCVREMKLEARRVLCVKRGRKRCANDYAEWSEIKRYQNPLSCAIK